MKKLLLPILFLCASVAWTDQPAAASKAAPADPQLDKAISESIQSCSDPVDLKRTPLEAKLPAGMTGTIVTAESKQPGCSSQGLAIRTSQGHFYFGVPWLIPEDAGTREQRIQKFVWDQMQQTFTAHIDDKQTMDGLQHVTLSYVTEYGKIPLEGWVDPSGKIFFLGSFSKLGDDLARIRLKQIEPYLGMAPAKGPADAAVTLIEFSDFECPSCRESATYTPALLKKYDGKIRYTRVDFPLLSVHPWAFPAALMGRAIWKQSPDAFWEFKEQLYGNQPQLNAFALEEFVKGFITSHQLDEKRFNEDVASQKVKDEVLAAVGAGLTMNIAATPSFMVNGTLVAPGKGGENLDRYLAKLLAGK